MTSSLGGLIGLLTFQKRSHVQLRNKSQELKIFERTFQRDQAKAKSIAFIRNDEIKKNYDNKNKDVLDCDAMTLWLW